MGRRTSPTSRMQMAPLESSGGYRHHRRREIRLPPRALAVWTSLRAFSIPIQNSPPTRTESPTNQLQSGKNPVLCMQIRKNVTFNGDANNINTCNILKQCWWMRENLCKRAFPLIIHDGGYFPQCYLVLSGIYVSRARISYAEVRIIKLIRHPIRLMNS